MLQMHSQVDYDVCPSPVLQRIEIKARCVYDIELHVRSWKWYQLGVHEKGCVKTCMTTCVKMCVTTA